MKLSDAYTNYPIYAVVYHIYEDSEEVEFVKPKLFKTRDKALKWFHKNYDAVDFIQPEVVCVRGLLKLNLQSLIEEQNFMLDRQDS